MNEELRKQEQLNKASVPAEQEPQETYSLEDILNEFGGWSKRAPAPAAPAARAEKKEEAPTPPLEDKVREYLPKPQQAEKKDLSGETVRFTPVAEKAPQTAEPVKIWSYEPGGQTEKMPELPAQADRKQQAKAARQAAAEEKRDRQQEAFLQKKLRKQTRKQKRADAQAQPEHCFASPEEAYAAYGKKNGLQARLAICVILCVCSVVMLVFSNYSVAGLDFSEHTTLFSILMLAILMLQAVLACDAVLHGVIQMLRMRFDQHSLLVLLTVVTAADSFFAIAQQRTPFCTVASVAITASLWGSSQLTRGKRKTLKAVCSMDAPVAAAREENAWHGKDSIFRKDGDAGAFVNNLEQPDVTSRIMRVYAPITALLTLALSILTAYHGKQNFLWAWAALLAASYPVGILIAFARPFAIHASRLVRNGAAVAGWYGAKTLGRDCCLVIEDRDLFPKANVTLNGMKMYSDRSVSQIIGYGSAVVESAGSGLTPLFEEMMHNQNGRHYTVDSFRRYEGGGLGAEIRGDVILMGSLAFMKLMRVRMPEGARVKQAVYLSLNGDLAAVFALSYAPASAVRSSLLAASHAPGLLPLLATRDFMITPQFLKQRYKLQPDRVEFPTVEERAQLSDHQKPREGKEGALMARGSFNCFVSAVLGARSLRSAVLGSMLVALSGGILGLMVLFFLIFIGSVQAVSAWNLFLYMILWLFPGFLITSLIGKS